MTAPSEYAGTMTLIQTVRIGSRIEGYVHADGRISFTVSAEHGDTTLLTDKDQARRLLYALSDLIVMAEYNKPDKGAFYLSDFRAKRSRDVRIASEPGNGGK